MSDKTHNARLRYERASELYRYSWSIFRVYIVALVTVISLQTFNLQRTVVNQQKEANEQLRQAFDQERRENEQRHMQTQQYVKCIVLLPLAERTTQNFDLCGKTGEVRPKETEEEATQSVLPSPLYRQPYIQPATPQPAQPRNEPTTSAPPEPEQIEMPASVTEQPAPEAQRPPIRIPTLRDIVNSLPIINRF